MVPRALRFPRQIVSPPETPRLLRDDEVWLRRQLAPLPQACEATTRAQPENGGRLALWRFPRRDQLLLCPVLQFRNRVFCRTHRFDRAQCSAAPPTPEQGDRGPAGSTATRQCPPPGKEVTSRVPPRDSAGCNVAALKQNASNRGNRPGKALCRIARQTSMMPRCNAPFLLSRHRGGLRVFLQSAYRNPSGESDKDRHNPFLTGANCGRS